MRRFPSPGRASARTFALSALFALLSFPALGAAPAVAADPGPAGTELAPGVLLIRGDFVPGRQPDGNAVVFAGPAGLVVVDTGRHVAHGERIVALATAMGRPVVAIVNTHWHLDHIGGNARLRETYPAVRVHASGALAGAMKGFLAHYRKQLGEMIAGAPSAEAAAPLRAELAILDAGPALAPDEVVTSAGERTLAGRTLRLGLETHAVTAGDVWLLDPATRVLVAGDLVTLPAPFLDTACPSRWQAALARLAQEDFALLIPGHGPPLTPVEVGRYRTAFDGLLACGASKRPKSDCADAWVRDAGPLIPAADQAFTRQLIEYYVESALRGDAARTKELCGG